MKMLLVNGSPNKKGCTNRALEEVSKTLSENGIDNEILWLGNKPVQDCIACYKCREIGKCIFDDIVNETAERFDEFDGIVIGSPVYYGGPTGSICSFMDRLMFSIDSDKITGKLASSVVSCRRGGASGAFERMNQFFLMTNMHVVSSQYWNQVHGFTPEDVEKDLEGLQTMRTLARNIAYLLKAQKEYEKNGFEKPEHEEIIPTHFIQ